MIIIVIIINKSAATVTFAINELDKGPSIYSMYALRERGLDSDFAYVVCTVRKRGYTYYVDEPQDEADLPCRICR